MRRSDLCLRSWRTRSTQPKIRNTAAAFQNSSISELPISRTPLSTLCSGSARKASSLSRATTQTAQRNTGSRTTACTSDGQVLLRQVAAAARSG